MIGSNSFLCVAVIFDFDSRRRLRKQKVRWTSWAFDERTMWGRKEESTSLPRPAPAPAPAPTVAFCDLCLVFASLPQITVKRFSDVPWISNTTENDFVWFYFQKVVANQLSAKVAMTPFYKLPKDDISVSFLTTVIDFSPLFCFVLWTFCVWKQLQRKWFEVLAFTSIAKQFGYP